VSPCMEEAELGTQAPIKRSLLTSCWVPTAVRHVADVLLNRPGIGMQSRVLIKGRSTAIPQQIGIPVLASADAAIAGFEGPNEPFQIIVSAR
jgi:hypothetical protein